MKQTAVIVCPGRGTYNKAELGYISRHHAAKRDLLAGFDAQRSAAGQVTISELDGRAAFSAAEHTRGDNASALIYAASYLDSLDVQEAFDVVAVTGNSMGWYTTLAVAGAVSASNGFTIANTMGRLMQESLIGGQSLYPFVDANWRRNLQSEEALRNTIAEIGRREGCMLSVSIELGGMLVVAGNAAGLDAFEAAVPPLQGRFPLKLQNHAAFHSAVQAPVAAQGQAALTEELFGSPACDMIDGRGAIWSPQCVSPSDLRAYTLGHQVTETYDFTSAIRVAARSFAPDVFVVLGPGDTMGGAVAQSLIAIDWRGLDSKETFMARQKEDPVILSMGRDEDRARLFR